MDSIGFAVDRAAIVDYHDGLRYPALERIPGTPDRFEALFEAL